MILGGLAARDDAMPRLAGTLAMARFRGRDFDDGLFGLDRQQRLIDDQLLPSLGA